MEFVSRNLNVTLARSEWKSYQKSDFEYIYIYIYNRFSTTNTQSKLMRADCSASPGPLQACGENNACQNLPISSKAATKMWHRKNIKTMMDVNAPKIKDRGLLKPVLKWTGSVLACMDQSNRQRGQRPKQQAIAYAQRVREEMAAAISSRQI